MIVMIDGDGKRKKGCGKENTCVLRAWKKSEDLIRSRRRKP